MLDYVPGSFRVIRHVRPKLSCRTCEAIAQAPAPSLPVRRGRAGARPAGARAGGEILPTICRCTGRRRSTPARRSISAARRWPTWLGQSARAWLRPLVDARGPARDGGARGCTPTTPVVPVLEPGRGPDADRRGSGRTCATAGHIGGADPHRRRCTATRPDRQGRASAGAPARRSAGILQADGYAGFGGLYRRRAR